MFRPNNPRFPGGPAANRGRFYVPNPIQRKPNNAQSKDASISTQSQAQPAARNPFGPDINTWKSPFAKTQENDKDKISGSDKNSSPKRKRFHSYYPDENPASDQSHESHGRWDIEASQQRSQDPILFPFQQTDLAERAAYSSGSGTADHKDADYRPEVTTAKDLGAPTVHLPPPPPLHNFIQLPVYPGADMLPPPRPEVRADTSKTELVPHEKLISCDLCEVALSNGLELEEHLDTKTHWDTLEYIQKHNNYDDMAIAFLQDVMIYKSRKSSPAIEDTALQALQEFDHMTKVEVFHCAACNAFVPTSDSAVQNHLTTHGHLTNTKEFEARRRRLCLGKANTMMKELTPQFISFAKGASPFK